MSGIVISRMHSDRPIVDVICSKPKIFCATARQLTDLGQDRRRSGQTASGWPKSIAAAVSKARIAWLPRVAPVW